MLNSTVKRSQLSLDKCLKVENYDAAIQQLLAVKTFRSFTKDQKILLSKLLYSKYFALKLKYDHSEPQYANFDDFFNNFTLNLDTSYFEDKAAKSLNNGAFWTLNQKLDKEIGLVDERETKGKFNTDFQKFNLLTFTQKLKQFNEYLAPIAESTNQLENKIDIASSMAKCSTLQPIPLEFYETNGLEELLKRCLPFQEALDQLLNNHLASEYRTQNVVEQILKLRSMFYEKFNDFLSEYCCVNIPNSKIVFEDRATNVPGGFNEFFEFQNVLKSLEYKIRTLDFS